MENRSVPQVTMPDSARVAAELIERARAVAPSRLPSEVARFLSEHLLWTWENLREFRESPDDPRNTLGVACAQQILAMAERTNSERTCREPAPRAPGRVRTDREATEEAITHIQQACGQAQHDYPDHVAEFLAKHLRRVANTLRQPHSAVWWERNVSGVRAARQVLGLHPRTGDPLLSS